MPVIVYDGQNITAQRPEYRNHIELLHNGEEIAAIGSESTPAILIVDAIRNRTNWDYGVTVIVDQISDLILQWNFYDFFGSAQAENINIIVPRALIDQFTTMLDGYHDFTPLRFGEHHPELLFNKNEEKKLIGLRLVSNEYTFDFNRDAFINAINSDTDSVIKAESGQHMVIANETHYVMRSDYEEVKVLELVYITNEGANVIRHIFNEAEINFIKGDN